MSVRYIRISKTSAWELLYVVEQMSIYVCSVFSGYDRLYVEDAILWYHYENVIFTEAHFRLCRASTMSLFQENINAKSLTIFV